MAARHAGVLRNGPPAEAAALAYRPDRRTAVRDDRGERYHGADAPDAAHARRAEEHDRRRAETETDVTPTLTAPSGHSVEPTEPRTNGTGTLQISAEDTQTRSAGEIYTAMRPSLALVYADGNGGTAIVMTADGYLITNAHTVSGAESITVQLSDGMEYAAALSGMDEQ